MEFFIAALFVLFIMHTIVIQIQSKQIKVLREMINNGRNDYKIHKDIMKFSFNLFKAEVNKTLKAYQIGEIGFIERISDNLAETLFASLNSKTIRPKATTKKPVKKAKKWIKLKPEK